MVQLGTGEHSHSNQSLCLWQCLWSKVVHVSPYALFPVASAAGSWLFSLVSDCFTPETLVILAGPLWLGRASMPPYLKETKNNSVTYLNKSEKTTIFSTFEHRVVRSNKIEVKCTQVEWAAGLIYWRAFPPLLPVQLQLLPTKVTQKKKGGPWSVYLCVCCLLRCSGHGQC